MNGQPQNTPRQVNESIPFPPVSDEVWKMLLDRSLLPSNMAHMLSGEVWVTEEVDGEMRAAWKPMGSPTMNKAGIRFFMSMMSSAMSPDKIATSLTEREVNQMACEMVKTIIYIIAERGDEFAIAANSRRYVVDLLDHFYFANLTASRRGTILNALKSAYTREERVTEMPRQKKFSMPTFLG